MYCTPTDRTLILSGFRKSRRFASPGWPERASANQETVQTSALALLGVINEILDFSAETPDGGRQRLHFRVRDTGQGIAKEQQRRIF